MESNENYHLTVAGLS